MSGNKGNRSTQSKRRNTTRRRRNVTGAGNAPAGNPNILQAARLVPGLFSTQNLRSVTETGRPGYYWAGPRLANREAATLATFQLLKELQTYRINQRRLYTARVQSHGLKKDGKAYKRYAAEIAQLNAWFAQFPRRMAAALQHHEVRAQLNVSGRAQFHIGSTAIETPLTLAIGTRSEALVKLLLEAGADPNLPNGNSIPIVAVTNSIDVGQEDTAGQSMIELLLAHGANINGVTPFRVTILDTVELSLRNTSLASRREKLQAFIAYLRSRGAMTAAELSSQ